MTLSRQEIIDIYCERLDPSFWGEPLNALTNLAFIAAGAWVLRGPDPWGRLLGCITILVGLGSLAFHTFATPWAAALDVAFIGLFILTFAYVVPLRLWHLPVRLSALYFLGVVGLITLISLTAPALKQLFGYFPPAMYVGAWLSLLTYTLLSYKYGVNVAGRLLIVATLLFPLSLLMRELDEPLCLALPIGTHWLWHLLNAVVLGLCSGSLHTRHGSPQTIEKQD